MDGAHANMYFSVMRSLPPASRSHSPSAEIPAFFLYGEPLRQTDEQIVHIETIARRSRMHRWHIKLHRHRDLHQVLLIERGGVAAAIDALSATLRAPAVLIVPPEAVHTFRFKPETQGFVISFSARLVRRFTSSIAPEVLDVLQRPSLWSLKRNVVNTTDLEPLAHMLLREFSRSASGRGFALYGLLTALLSNLLRVTQDQNAVSETGSAHEREIVARFRQLLEDNYRLNLSVKWYANKLGLSDTRLRKLCHAVAGQSPVTIMHQRVLLEAERLLRHTSMTVNQIAYFLGFEDPAYFSRFFSKRAGISPKASRDGLNGP
jgi:AraC family transcriptional activator of pobA